MSIQDGFPVNAAYTNSRLMSKQDANSITASILTTKSYATAYANVASSANINSLSSTAGLVRITGSTATSLNGITAGLDGQELVLINVSSQAITVTNQSGSAGDASYRIINPTGASITVSPNYSAMFKYDAAQSRWFLISVYTPPSTGNTMRYNVVSTATGITATSGDEVICTAGGISIAVPSSPTTGDLFCVIKTDTGLGTSNAVTITGTIDGVSNTTLDTQYERAIFCYNGSSWNTQSRSYPSLVSSAALTLTGFGSPTIAYSLWTRTGNRLFLDYRATLGTRTGVEARANFPSGLVASSTYNTTTACGIIGSNASTSVAYYHLIEPSVGYFTFGFNVTPAVLTKQLGNNIFADGTVIAGQASCIIQGWK